MHTLPLLFNDVDGYEVLSEELKNEIRKSGVDIKKDLNINDILKQQEEQILQPMDQVFTDIGNTIHYEGNKMNTVIEQNQEPVTTLPVTEEVDQTEANKPNQDKTPSDEV